MATAAMDEMLDLFCEMKFMRKTTTAYTFGNCGVFVYHVFDEFKKAIIDGLREGGLAVTWIIFANFTLATMMKRFLLRRKFFPLVEKIV